MLSEDDCVEAWLLMKQRAGLRGVATGALLGPELATCSVCGGWFGRAPGSNPKCTSMFCPGAASDDGVGIYVRQATDGTAGLTRRKDQMPHGSHGVRGTSSA